MAAPGYDICPKCGLQSESNCRCAIGDRTCANGHHWATCKVHGKVECIIPPVTSEGIHPHPIPNCPCRGQSNFRLRNESTLPGAPKIKERMMDLRGRHDEKEIPGPKDLTKGILPRRDPPKVAPKDRSHHKLSESAEACLMFLSENINLEQGEICKNLKGFAYRDELRNLVSHIILTNLSGWNRKGDLLIHESGRVALQSHWELLTDGHLSPRMHSAVSAKYRQLNLDKLYKFIDGDCDG